MANLAKDSMFEASPGVLITAHTESGPGATGGPVVMVLKSDGTVAAVTSLSGGGFVGQTLKIPNCYYSGSAGATDVTLTVRFGYDEYCSVALFTSGIGTGVGYTFNRIPGSGWQLNRTDGTGNTPIGTGSSPYFDTTPLSTTADTTMQIVWTPGGGITCKLNGVTLASLSATDTTYDGPFYAGFGGYSNPNVVYKSILGTSGGGPLAAGALIACRVSGNITTVGVRTAAATGGTGPYTYALQESSDGGTTWSGTVGTLTAGVPTGVVRSALTAGAARKYRVVVTDSAAATATSNVIDWVVPAYAAGFDGNSIFAGFATTDAPGATAGPAHFPVQVDGTTPGADPPSQALRWLRFNQPGGWAAKNFAVGSQTGAMMLADFAAQVLPEIAACLAAGGTYVYVVAELGNDVYLGDLSAAAAVANVWALCDQARAAGAKVLAVVPSPRTATGAVTPGTFQARFAAGKTQMRAEWPGHADGLLDLDALDAAKSSNRPDGTHDNDAGAATTGLFLASALAAAATYSAPSGGGGGAGGTIGTALNNLTTLTTLTQAAVFGPRVIGTGQVIGGTTIPVGQIAHLNQAKTKVLLLRPFQAGDTAFSGVTLP